MWYGSPTTTSSFFLVICKIGLQIHLNNPCVFLRSVPYMVRVGPNSRCGRAVLGNDVVECEAFTVCAETAHCVCLKPLINFFIKSNTFLGIYFVEQWNAMFVMPTAILEGSINCQCSPLRLFSQVYHSFAFHLFLELLFLELVPE